MTAHISVVQGFSWKIDVFQQDSHSFSVSLALYQQFNTTHTLSHSLTCVGWIFALQTSDNWTNVNIFFLCVFVRFLPSFHFSCREAASWQWWSMTLWPAMAAAVGSWRYAEGRLWRFWSDSTISRTGAWCGPRTALRLRRALYPAPCSVLLTPGPPWRWRGSSTTKVGEECFLRFLYLHAQVDWELFSHTEAHLDFPEH